MCALFAATFPERTSALVLGASYARRTWAPDYPWGLDEEAQQRILDGYEERWGQDRLRRSARSPRRSRTTSASGSGTRRRSRFAGTPASALAWFRVTMEIDVRDVLPAIRVPTLVLHRAGDRVIPVEAGRYLAEHIPGAKFVELPGRRPLPVRRRHRRDRRRDRGVPHRARGARREPDRVLATVLFTDIVGSTERAAELGDRRWRSSSSEHHAIVREPSSTGIAARRSASTGDGFLATFDGPARAVRCACAIRDARARARRRDPRRPAHRRDRARGDGVEGIAVHIGARVAALARAGRGARRRARSRTSSSARGSSSPTAGRTSSRACRASGTSTSSLRPAEPAGLDLRTTRSPRAG